MKREDFNFAISAANQEGWEYETRDLERFLEVFPDGLFLAEEAGRRLGWMIACMYGRFMWVGGLVVQSEARHRGIGTLLMERAIDYSTERGARTVALYAHPRAIPFYSAIEFHGDCEFVLLQGGTEKIERERFDVEKPEVSEVMPLDMEYFRGDRSRPLQILRNEFGEFFIAPSNGTRRSYIVGRKYADGSAEIGPWVCGSEDVEVAEKLLEAELSRLDSPKIRIVVPELNSNALRILEEHSFHEIQRSPRMYRGVAEDLPRVDGIYAAGGWDIG